MEYKKYEFNVDEHNSLVKQKHYIKKFEAIFAGIPIKDKENILKKLKDLTNKHKFNYTEIKHNKFIGNGGSPASYYVTCNTLNNDTCGLGFTVKNAIVSLEVQNII